MMNKQSTLISLSLVCSGLGCQPAGLGMFDTTAKRHQVEYAPEESVREKE